MDQYGPWAFDDTEEHIAQLEQWFNDAVKGSGCLGPLTADQFAGRISGLYSRLLAAERRAK